MPKNSPIPVIETERLLLRPFAGDDAPAVEELLATPEISATTLNIAFPYPAGAADEWIASHAEQAREATSLHWAIVRASDSHLIGAIGLSLVREHSRGSLGYWLGVQFWNRGYMSEAVIAVTEYAFGALDVHRVEASCFPRNVASSKVLENAGLTYEGTLRRYFRKGDAFEDVALYARVMLGR